LEQVFFIACLFSQLDLDEYNCWLADREEENS